MPRAIEDMTNWLGAYGKTYMPGQNNNSPSPVLDTAKPDMQTPTINRTPGVLSDVKGQTTGTGTTTGSMSTGVSPGPVTVGTTGTTPSAGATDTKTDPATQGTAGQGMNYTNDYLEQANKLLTQLTAMQDFKYTYQNDPAYLAAVQSFKEGAQTATRQTEEEMNNRGIANSTIASSQLGQIQARAQNEPLKLLPQFESNAFNRYQTKFSNNLNLFGQLQGAGQWEKGFTADQAYRDKTFAADQSKTEADMTGTWESPQMLDLMNQNVQYKKDWASATTPEDRAKAAAGAKQARAALAGLTGRTPAEVDKMFGANVGVDQALASFGRGGVQTQASKQYAEASKQYADDVKYRAGRDKVGDKHWDSTFNQTERLAKIRAANSGGGGGGGASLSDTKFILDQNTDMMYYEMVRDGVDSKEKAINWMKLHNADVTSGRVDPNALLTKWDKSGGTAGPSNYDMYQKAYDMAQKDPRMKGKPDPNSFRGGVIPLTAEEQNAIVQEHLTTLQSYANPQPTGNPVDGLTELFKAGNKGLDAIKGLFGGGKKK